MVSRLLGILLRTLLSAVRTRRELALENLELRQQLGRRDDGLSGRSHLGIVVERCPSTRLITHRGRLRPPLSSKPGTGVGLGIALGRLPHGFLKSVERSLDLTPQHIGCIARLIALLHQAFRDSTQGLRPAPYCL